MTTTNKPSTPRSNKTVVSRNDLRPVVLGSIAPGQEASHDALTKGCDPSACEESDYYHPVPLLPT
jgi:hypothetical protein